jgi:hypothetical protein
MQAAIHMEPKIQKMAGRAAVSALSGGVLHGSELKELVHLLHKTAHGAKENLEEITKEDESADRRCR